jgi:hypothetical protein
MSDGGKKHVHVHVQQQVTAAAVQLASVAANALCSKRRSHMYGDLELLCSCMCAGRLLLASTSATSISAGLKSSAGQQHMLLCRCQLGATSYTYDDGDSCDELGISEEFERECEAGIPYKLQRAVWAFNIKCEEDGCSFQWLMRPLGDALTYSQSGATTERGASCATGSLHMESCTSRE